ncbi:MAG: hypothetical protein IT385_26555 [Deltaproteobacteria bacterium]|nr:hypothetical protein [Deltaproteobacteria bacterium]
MAPRSLGLTVTLVLALSSAGARGAPTCEDLDALPSTREDEAATWARAIWREVVSAHARIDPAATAPALRVVDGTGAAGAAGAWYCRGRDTVYVARALVDYGFVGRGSDGAELVAFALAHELAHRRFDDGDAPFSGPCPEGDAALEARADRRAALLVALALEPGSGRRFEPATLARRGALEVFFVAELGWDEGCPALAERLAAVGSALARLDELAWMWDLGSTLVAAAGAGGDAAAHVLEALHASASGVGADGAWDALPELGLLRAQAHIQRAGAAGWCGPEDGARIRARSLAVDPCAQACTLVTPGRARVSPELPREPRRAGVDPAVELARASILIAGARAGGVPDVDLAGTEACLAYLARDPSGALAALARVGPGATPRVRAALRDDRALFEIQRALLRDEPLDARAGAWLAAREVPAPIVAAAAPPTSSEPACPEVPERSARLSGGRVTRAGPCVALEVAGARMTLVDHPVEGRARALASWAAACQLGSPLVDTGGRARVAARCEGDARWVLELEGDDRVTRATRIEGGR